jgi:hypothetical protein
MHVELVLLLLLSDYYDGDRFLTNQDGILKVSGVQIKQDHLSHQLLHEYLLVIELDMCMGWNLQNLPIPCKCLTSLLVLHAQKLITTTAVLCV